MKYEKEFNKLCKKLNIEYDKIYNKNETTMSLLIKIWEAAIKFMNNRSCKNCKHGNTTATDIFYCHKDWCLGHSTFTDEWEPKDETK